MSVGELMVSPQQAGAMAVYDRVGPMEFVEKFGKVFWVTGAGGAKTKEEGELLALACLCERKTIFDINREFHLMDGKLSMRADAMLAGFRRKGGKHRWLKTDDNEAELELTYDGQVTISRYTIEDAKRAGLIKPKGNWEKSPRSMLRARACSEGVRMVTPEVVAGYYTPEENEDIAADVVKTAAPSTTAADVKKRQKELKEMEAKGGVTTSPAATATESVSSTETKPGEVIDASFTVVPDAVEAPATTADSTVAATAEPVEAIDITKPGSSTTETLLEIEMVLGKAGMTKAKLEEQLRKKNADFTTLDSLSEESARKLLANLEAKIGAGKK